MYNVMIVDDEVYLTVLISKLVDWSEFNMQVTAISHDGDDAYKKAQETKFDLIIVDVRMPGCDGITLMEKLRETNKSTRFIVISGHKSFDYARGALQNDAEDYLLKPIGRSDLEQILRRVQDKLDTEKGNIEMINSINRKYEIANFRMRGRAMEYLMHAENVSEKELHDSLKQDFGVDMCAEHYFLLCITIDYMYVTSEFENNDIILTKLAEQIHASVGQYVHEWLLCIQDNMLLCLLNYGNESRESVIEQIHMTETTLNAFLNRFESITATISLGGEFDSLSAFSDEMAILRQCNSARVALGTGRIIIPERLRSNTQMVAGIYNEYAEHVQEAVKAFNAEKLKLYIRDVMLRGDMLRMEDSLIYYKLSEMILREIYEYMSRIEICTNTYEQFSERVTRELNWAYTPQLFIQKLNDFVADYLKEHALGFHRGENPAIRIAKTYITEHYAEDISLSHVAKIVNITPIYFSMLFKKEVGINFLDYLNQYRIRMAKEFLKDIRCNINEVAARSGFESPKYFSQVFKKNIGITPTEYRKRHLNGADYE